MWNNKTMIILTIGVLIISLALELIFKPRIDYTRKGDTVLWYGRKNRKYIIIKTIRK